MAHSTLEKMKGVQSKYKESSDLMQASAYDQDELIDVRNAPSRKRGAVFGSFSKKQAATVKATNQTNQVLKTQQRSAVAGEGQLAATHQQTKLMGKQTQLAQQQSMTMKQVHQTMEQILHLLSKDQNKLSPNYQAFAKGQANDPYFGTPEDGMIDKMGSILGDLLGGAGDLIGGRGRGRGNRGGRGGRGGPNGRGGRGPGGRGGPGSPSMWSKLKGKLSGVKMPKGGGRAGVIAALLAGGAYGANELFDFFGGDEEAAPAGDLDLSPQRQAMNAGAHLTVGAGSVAPWQHYANAMGSPFTGAAGLPSGWMSQLGVPSPGGGGGGQFPAPAGQENNYGYNPTFTGKVSYDGLGSIAASEESGGKGVAAVSTGRGDHGGVSYGKHQLASRNGSMSRFLASPDGQKYAAEFQGMQPGSAAFTDKYRQIVARDAKGFEQAQSDYIARTHYKPQLDKVSQGTGIDMSTRGKAVQEMLYSTGVQYGGSTSVILSALRGKNVAGMSDAELISTVQDFKRETVGQYFKSSSGDVQRSVANRAAREKAKLLALNTQELQAKANGEDSKKQDALAGAEGVTATQAAVASHPTTTAAQVPALLAPMKPDASAPAGEVASAAPQVPPMLAPMPAPSETVAEASAAPTDDIGGPGDFMTKMRSPPKIDMEGPRVSPTPASSAAAPALEAAEKGAGKGLLKGTAKTVGKAIPYVGPAIMAAEGVSIMTDDEASRAEKQRAGSELAGGTAGMMVGAKAGAAGGAAIGAGIGSFFFGVGAVPGAAIGGFVGGLGGGALGYWGGSELGGAAYDAAAGTPEEQAAAEAAKANSPVSGVSPTPVSSTPLIFPMAKPETQTATQVAATAQLAPPAVTTSDKPLTPGDITATVQKAMTGTTAAPASPATPAPAPVDGKKAEETAAVVNAASDVSASAQVLATAATAGALSSAMPKVPDAQALAAQTAQTGAAATGGVGSTVMSAMAGAMSAGLGLPPGWAEQIASGYAGAQAHIDAALASNGAVPQPATQSALPTPGGTPSPVVSAPAPAPAAASAPVLPSSVESAPVTTAPSAVNTASPSSPASPNYYTDSDLSPQASALSATATAGTVSASGASPASPVTAAGAAPPQVERTPYEPVKAVMMLEPKQQNTMMPDHFKASGNRTPSGGISEGNSIRPTIDDCPAIITGDGLVLLQTGFI